MNNQTENLKKALDLELFIRDKTKELNLCLSETFSPIPPVPQRKTITLKMPDIQPTIKFNWPIAIALGITTSGIGALVYYFAYYKPKKQEEIKAIEASANYKEACNKVLEQQKEQQAKEDEIYNQAKNKYDTITLPKYKQDLNAWTIKHNAKIKDLENEIKKATIDLEKHYSSTKIIPKQYRSIDALKYIYDMVSSSDYNIKEAIESYDKNEQRKLEQARIVEQQQANQLAYEQNQLAYEQNELLTEQNKVAKKAHRDQNIASIVGTVQRHNTNKQFKKWINK